MNHIKLRVYQSPGEADVFIVLKGKAGGFERLAAIIDTGAEVTLLPARLPGIVEHDLTQRGKFIVGQAGIAKQTFEAIEAFMTLFLEDETGAQTGDFKAWGWFADAKHALLGVTDILDRAALFIDIPNLRGYRVQRITAAARGPR